jgi:translation initiation factor 3 subunit I
MVDGAAGEAPAALTTTTKNDARKGKQNTHAIQPIALKGHTRSITFVQFNRDSDLLFTCAKDSTPTVFYAANGERIGTFNGHTGANTKLNVSADSSLLITGAADMFAKLWNVKNGHCIKSWRHSTPVRAVGINLGGDQVLTANDPVMRQEPTIYIWDVDDGTDGSEAPEPVAALTGHRSKINQAIWGPLNETIFSCSDDGTVRIWNPEARKQMVEINAHDQKIMNMSFAKDYSHFITASADQTAKMYDTETQKLLRTFESDAPINASAISPTKNHIILGGGQEAANVTMSDARMGKFEIKWFHKVFGDELGAVRGHFGPINTLDFNYDGSSFASGAEDGYVRIHNLPSTYITAADNLLPQPRD